MFGPDGFSGANFAAPTTKPSDVHAVDAIIAAAKAHPGELQIFALAPLTNIAIALNNAPEILPMIKTIWFMGAMLHAVGNITMGAEFNVWVDPEATDMVLRSGLPLVIKPWETAKRDAVLSLAERDEIGRMDTPVARFFSRLAQMLYSYTTKVEEFGGAILSDINGVTVPLFPDEIREQADTYMCVEFGGEHSRGVTLLDWVGLAGKIPNVSGQTAVVAGRVAMANLQPSMTYRPKDPCTRRCILSQRQVDCRRSDAARSGWPIGANAYNDWPAMTQGRRCATYVHCPWKMPSD